MSRSSSTMRMCCDIFALRPPAVVPAHPNYRTAVVFACRLRDGHVTLPPARDSRWLGSRRFPVESPLPTHKEVARNAPEGQEDSPAPQGCPQTGRIPDPGTGPGRADGRTDIPIDGRDRL